MRKTCQGNFSTRRATTHKLPPAFSALECPGQMDANGIDMALRAHHPPPRWQDMADLRSAGLLNREAECNLVKIILEDAS